MQTFEVFIPPKEAGVQGMAFHIDAEKWLDALRSGLQAIGEQGDCSNSLMIDVKSDNSIHATDSMTGRVFRIRPLTREEIQRYAQLQQAAVVPLPPREPVAQPPPPPRSVPAATSAPPPLRPRTQPLPKAVPAKVPTREIPKLGATAVPGQPFVVPETLKRSVPVAAVEMKEPIGRAISKRDLNEILANVFEKAQEVYDTGPDQEKGINYMLDLLMDAVPAESGSVCLADINEHDLFFGATRGPKAEEVKRFRVPMGVGIVGFSAAEGVSLAVSDVKRDPRFYREISEKIKYDTRSILCAPMVYEGQCLGAMELINKRGNDTFTADELSIAEYISKQTAEYLMSTMDEASEE